MCVTIPSVQIQKTSFSLLFYADSSVDAEERGGVVAFMSGYKSSDL